MHVIGNEPSKHEALNQCWDDVVDGGPALIQCLVFAGKSVFTLHQDLQMFGNEVKQMRYFHPFGDTTSIERQFKLFNLEVLSLTLNKVALK